MSHLHLSLLGGFQAALDGQPITGFDTDKTRALLAYLAVEAGRPHRRAGLAALLWPESPAQKAAHNLSQTLLRLRRALREEQPAQANRQPFLLVSSQDIQFNPLSDHRLDVAEFVELLRAHRQHRHVNTETCSVCIGWLRQAADRYRGDLLAGFSLRDSVPFEEWLLVQQEALHGQIIEALELLVTYYERRGEPEQVREYARRLVVLEPWQEQAQIKLMVALTQCGQETAALEQYVTYSQMLAQEFDQAPSAAATALYNQIRARQSGGPRTASSQGKIAVSGPAAQGERRQVTALVCGRCDATRRSDPEEELERLARCSIYCDPVLERFGGQRQARQGTTCLIYFGHPVAYEDAAQQAVHAGLAMAKAARDSDHSLAIGIHTGMMVSVAGELVGDVPNLARRCQRMAGANSVWLTGDTERLVRGWFDCQTTGTELLPGSAEPIAVYRVAGVITARDRLARLAQTRRPTRFVGREQEQQQLAACLTDAQQGRGRVITLCGEPGIGKSRLVWELSQVNSGAVIWLESHCSPYFQNTSLYPLIHLLEQLIGFERNDDPHGKRAKLDRVLARHGLAGPAQAWLLALLLGLPTDTPAPQTITEDLRERMRTAFFAVLGRCAAEQPMVLVIEDLHWADPSTVAWLDASLDALAATGCLALLTHRPTFIPSWQPRPQQLQFTLGPLNPEQVSLMITDLAGGTDVPDELRRRVVAQTDGIPLFVEELTKTVLEAGGPLLGTDIPATLSDSLLARLDGVGRAKETAQWAAVLGREFAYPVLAVAVPYGEQPLQDDLALLVEAGLVYRSNDGSQESYAFKHILIQQAAYASLLRRTRRTLHHRIAEIYATRFPQIAEAQPELLAEHYHQAGLPIQAADHWLQAGERATAQGATLEAKIFFERALALIEPGDDERRWRALWGHETALYFRGERLAQRADIVALLALAENFDEDTRRAQAQSRRLRFASSQADYQEQSEAADAAMAAARRVGNATLELEALAYKLTAMMRLGERTMLPEVVESTLALTQRVGDDGLRSYAMASVALYYFEDGDLARAAQILSQSLDTARRAKSRQLDLECQYHGHLGLVYAQLGLYTDARATLDAGLELADRLGIGRYRAYQMLNLGLVHWRMGDLNSAIQMEEAALAEYSTTGEAFGQAACRAYLGSVYEAMGDLGAAAQYLAEARAVFADLGVEPDTFEAQAAEARVLLARGRATEARQLTADVWRYLCAEGTEGLSSPSWVYICVADVLDAVEIPGITLREVLETAYHELMARAQKISDLDWRQSFLQNVTENNAVMERWQQIQGNGVRPVD